MSMRALKVSESLDFVGEKSVKEQEKAIEKCETLCSSLVTIIKTDVLNVETERITKASDLENKSTVGVITSGVIVENTLLGGPAWDTGLIVKGDKILSVNGEPVTGQNVTKLLVGEDVPGSIITVDLQRGQESVQVQLTRMPSSKIADRRKMFEYFASIKNCLNKMSAGNGGNLLSGIGMGGPSADTNPKAAIKIVDDAIELFNGICRAEADHSNVVVENVLKMQVESINTANAMMDSLKELHAIYNRDVQFFSDEQKKHEVQLAALKTELEALRIAMQKLNDEKQDSEVHLHELEDKLKAMEAERLEMRKTIAALKRDVADEEHKRHDLEHDVEGLQKQIAAFKMQRSAFEDNIASLEAKIKELVKEANSLKKKLVDEEHLKHDVEHERDAALDKVKKLELMLADLNKRLADKDGELTSMKEALENEQHLLHDMEHDRDAFKRELDKLNKEIFEMGQMMDNQKQVIARLQGELSRLSSLDATCSAYEKNIADLKAQLEMLRAQMAKSQSELAKDEDALKNLRDERDKLSKMNEELHREIKRLAEANGVLSATIQQKDKDIHRATSDLLTEQNKSASLEQEIASLNVEKDALSREVKRLESELAREKSGVAGLNETIATLKQRLLDMEASMAEVEKARNDSLRQMKALEVELANCKANCARKDSELAEMQRKLDAANADLKAAQAALADVQAERDAARLECNKLQAALTRANDEIAKLESSVAALSAKSLSNTPTDEDVGYRLLTAKLRKRIKELEDELARLKANVPIAGVGMLLDKHIQEGVIYISKIIPGGAAFDSHKILRGDILRSVDGNTVATLKMDDIFALIQGAEGTPITLEIERRASNELFYVPLRRKVITRQSAQAESGFSAGIPGGPLASSMNRSAAQAGGIRSQSTTPFTSQAAPSPRPRANTPTGGGLFGLNL